MNEKILIIDDEKEITELIEVFLKNESYQVFKTYSAKEAVHVINKESIDLAIVDVNVARWKWFQFVQAYS